MDDSVQDRHTETQLYLHRWGGWADFIQGREIYAWKVFLFNIHLQIILSEIDFFFPLRKNK